MKIAYCIAAMYRSGGMERVITVKANWLARHGHDVTIITSDQMDRPYFFPLDASIKCHDLGINYEEFNGESFLKKALHFPGKQLRHKNAMRNLLRKIDPDVVVSTFCNEANFLTDIHPRSKKILEVHFSRFKRLQYGRGGMLGFADRLRSKADGALVRKYDRFVVLTSEDKGYWGDLPNIEVINNPVSFEMAQQSPLDCKTAIAVGRFSHQKSFDRMIDAWRLVAERHPDWKLRIFGDGETRDELLQKIADCGLTGKVELCAPTSDIASEYLRSSMFLLSSRYEGLPMVLIEAQCAGLPIVSFACKCGPREVVTDGKDGFLVADGDIRGMADRVCELIEQPALLRKIGDNAHAGSHRFDTDAIMEQWQQLFEEVRR